MTRATTVATIGERRSRLVRLRVAEELLGARIGVGISRREMGRRIGVSADRIARAEAGHPEALTFDVAARMAPVVGLVLAAQLYPDGDPVRDRAHLALIERLRKRLGPGRRLRVEVPVPIAGDKRSGDAMLRVDGGDVLIEAETRLGDLQAMERRMAAKQRDLSATRLVLLVADTRHNRDVIRLHPEVRERFPVGSRAALAAFMAGRDPGGDAIVVL
jgi:transcriptional regulator with XRE-family HTH domain